ncbi:hypothetical protein CEP48_00405 [Mergibacter septicus]|uniref:Uncharacterized protein n=1 Tax=Mergibacter septicus TaxID=221402 RepID=A0A8E3MET4_9PAST|nr:DUF2798 domain-containing protein [Mergibacter septicus]AWX14740.1 hypothetical protein CEP47_00405 [Mergibacter septicus]QDJ13991.1 hypothetical protein CEP48_00405 [Mergibacter septicus]UTU48560.1 DUF2798 domain-containing protein [Mergibacter septicus]WMR95811.1 DUF2798 domain-containing protein [Mergibacter septicus]
MNRGFIPKKYASLVFTFYRASIMAFVMSSILVAINTGIDVMYFNRMFHSYCIAMPIAFFAAVITGPLVKRLMELTVKSSE